MKMKLNELVLSELIELSCGNYEVLLTGGDKHDMDELYKTARCILSDYYYIADNVHAKSMMYEKENEVKDDAHIMMLKICSVLAGNGGKEQARAILSDIGESVGDNISEQIDSMLKYAIFEQERNKRVKGEPMHRTAEEIRSSFYSEIAFMMTYFKMEINASTINAEVYANVVKQAGIEIRNKRKNL